MKFTEEQAEYKELAPGQTAYYDGLIEVDLSKVKPMIAMPFHPSNTYTIEELNANLTDILADVEKKAAVSLDNAVPYSLKDKVRDGRFYVDQGIIAGCAGGGFENICAAADILKGSYIGNQEFTLSVYPASMPIYMELIKNGCAATILETGAVMKTAFCGPCFGAGDTPANNAFSIRHSTRNFPNREGSKLQNGQIASVALMDARSIAATAANQGRLTAATELDVDPSANISIILIRRFIRIAYLIPMVWQIPLWKSISVRISRTGRRCARFRKIWCCRWFPRFTIRLRRQTS